MTINSRIKERGIRGLIIIFLYLGTGIYATLQAQTTGIVQAVSLVRNAGEPIVFRPKSQLDSKAMPLNPFINSPFAELKPISTPDGRRLYFSRSLHPGNTSGVSDQEDIWFADFESDTKNWSEPVLLPGLLNNGGPNFINNISGSGDTIILGNQYLTNGKMRDGLSYSVNEEGQWSTPHNIRVRNDYNLSPHANAFVDLRIGVIILAIQRAETLGERDLYVSFWDGKEATTPLNMGEVINSDLEESSPYLASDNKTLYFASKGHGGFGGYDIYVSHRLDGSWTSWSKPQNLGPLVNGELNEEFFNITHCGKYAIFSKQVSVHNTDLFSITTEELFGIDGAKQPSPPSAFATIGGFAPFR